MALEEKTIVDFENLILYDKLIKEYIDKQIDIKLAQNNTRALAFTNNNAEIVELQHKTAEFEGKINILEADTDGR